MKPDVARLQRMLGILSRDLKRLPKIRAKKRIMRSMSQIRAQEEKVVQARREFKKENLDFKDWVAIAKSLQRNERKRTSTKSSYLNEYETGEKYFYERRVPEEQITRFRELERNLGLPVYIRAPRNIGIARELRTRHRVNSVPDSTSFFVIPNRVKEPPVAGRDYNQYPGLSPEQTDILGLKVPRFNRVLTALRAIHTESTELDELIRRLGLENNENILRGISRRPGEHIASRFSPNSLYSAESLVPILKSIRRKAKKDPSILGLDTITSNNPRFKKSLVKHHLLAQLGGPDFDKAIRMRPRHIRNSARVRARLDPNRSIRSIIRGEGKAAMHLDEGYSKAETINLLDAELLDDYRRYLLRPNTKVPKIYELGRKRGKNTSVI